MSDPHSDRVGSPLTVLGGTLMAFALLGIIYFGVLFETSISQDTTPQLRALGQFESRIENIGLLSRREAGMTASAGLLIAGAVIFIGGRLEDRLPKHG